MDQHLRKLQRQYQANQDLNSAQAYIAALERVQDGGDALIQHQGSKDPCKVCGGEIVSLDGNQFALPPLYQGDGDVICSSSFLGISFENMLVGIPGLGGLTRVCVECQTFEGLHVSGVIIKQEIENAVFCECCGLHKGFCVLCYSQHGHEPGWGRVNTEGGIPPQFSYGRGSDKPCPGCNLLWGVNGEDDDWMERWANPEIRNIHTGYHLWKTHSLDDVNAYLEKEQVDIQR